MTINKSRFMKIRYAIFLPLPSNRKTTKLYISRFDRANLSSIIWASYKINPKGFLYRPKA
jgi:hypothetical protein